MTDLQIPVLSWRTALVVALTPLVWRFLRSRYHKYRREGITIIPGPDNQSFLQGLSCFNKPHSDTRHCSQGIIFTIGHFALLFSNDAWQFHRDLAHKCTRCRIDFLKYTHSLLTDGRTSRVKGPLNVCPT